MLRNFAVLFTNNFTHIFQQFFSAGTFRWSQVRAGRVGRSLPRRTHRQAHKHSNIYVYKFFKNYAGPRFESCMLHSELRSSTGFTV